MQTAMGTLTTLLPTAAVAPDINAIWPAKHQEADKTDVSWDADMYAVCIGKPETCSCHPLMHGIISISLHTQSTSRLLLEPPT